MSIDQLSYLAIKCLQRSNWSQSKKDISIMKKKLVEVGYNVSPPVIEFLEYFGDLHLNHAICGWFGLFKNIQPFEDGFYFDVIHCCEDNFEDCCKFEKLVDQKACYVGSYYMYNDVYITENGLVLGWNVNNVIDYFGNNTFEAIENMCRNKIKKYKTIN